MKEYMKMSDVFKGELFIDCDCDDVIVDELSLTVLESFSGSDAAKFALHAINSHDELVEMNKELLKTLKNALEECEFEIRHGGQVCVDTYAIRKAIEMAEGSAA